MTESSPPPHPQELPSSCELVADYVLEQALASARAIEAIDVRSHSLATIAGAVTNPELSSQIVAEALKWHEVACQSITGEDASEQISLMLYDIAGASLNPSLAERLEPYLRDHLKARIAWERNDPRLAPQSNEYGALDRYFTKLAIGNHDPSLAERIAGPEARACVFAALADQTAAAGDMHQRDAYREKAWQSLQELSDDAGHRSSALAFYAWDAEHAARIRHPFHRAEAYSRIIQSMPQTSPDPDVVRDIVAKAVDAVHEAQKTTVASGFQDAQCAQIIHRLAVNTEDMALALTIEIQSFRKTAIEQIIMRQAIAREDPELVQTAEPEIQGRALYGIVQRTGDAALAKRIVDMRWRARALAAASTHAKDEQAKQALQNEALSTAFDLFHSWASLGDLYDPAVEIELEELIIVMQDRRMTWRLLDRPQFSTSVLMRLAKRFDDPDFALQLPAGPERDQLLRDLAATNNRPELASHIQDAAKRVEAYLSIYRQNSRSSDSH